MSEMKNLAFEIAEQEAMKSGGWAFPASHFDLAVGEHGMTLRDYFAAMAMQGIAANPDISANAAAIGQSTEEFRRSVAEASYKTADAMLEARK